MNTHWRVKNVTNFSLFHHKCFCGEMTVHGFWQQIEKVVEEEKHRVIVYLPCSECGMVYSRGYRLTTSRGYPRIINWLYLFVRLLWLIEMVPSRWRQQVRNRLLFIIMWADRRIRL